MIPKRQCCLCQPQCFYLGNCNIHTTLPTNTTPHPGSLHSCLAGTRLAAWVTTIPETHMCAYPTPPLENTHQAGVTYPSQHCATMSINTSSTNTGVTDLQPTVTDDPQVFKEPVEIHFDGSHSTGKNLAAVGFIITDATGRVLEHNNFEIDYTTSVQTEFKALIHALNAAKDIGIQNARIYGDCSSVIELARGDVTTKDDLATVTDTAQSTLSTFDSYVIAHIDRSQNTLADSLSHTALDNADK